MRLLPSPSGGRSARVPRPSRPWVTVFVGPCLLLWAGCAASEANPRSLHYIDDELVHSRPPHARAYEAYLRARVALESQPPRLDEAFEYIEVAIRYEPREPQLWITRAEIEAEAGDVDRALASATRALELRPGYAPAQQFIVSLDGQGAAATAAAVEPSTAARHP